MGLVICYDAEGNPHQKEPIDAREACLHNGFSMMAPGARPAATNVEREPTKDELAAAGEALQRRERELDEQALTLADQARANAAEAERLAGFAAANEAEAQRLQSWAASLESEAARIAALAPPAAAETQTEAPTEAPAAAPKAGKATK